MNASRAQLYLTLLGPKLSFHLDEISSICKRGFDLQIRAVSEEVLEALLLLCAEWRDAGKLSFIYVSTEKALQEIREGTEMSTFLASPVVYMGPALPAGKFFLVPYKLPPLSALISPLSKCIFSILERFDLMMYIDCFDGTMVKRLKKVLEEFGLEVFIDAVVQIAFFAGFRGDLKSALCYLEELRAQAKAAPLGAATAQELKKSAQLLFNYALNYEEQACDMLKAAFCYFVLNREKQNVSQASRVLNVARSTILQYSRLAEQYGIGPLLVD